MICCAIIDLDAEVKMFIMHRMWQFGEAGSNGDNWPIGVDRKVVQSAHLKESCVTTEQEATARRELVDTDFAKRTCSKWQPRKAREGYS